MREIFSKKLFTARKLAGLTLEDLSTITQISKQTLSKYENELVTPNGDSLMRLCEALKVKPDYLLSETTQTIEFDNLRFREEFKINSSELEKIKLNTLIKIENYLQLEKLANEICVFKNPIDDIIVKDQEDAKKAANTLRKRWKLGNEPVRNVTDTLESKGIKIIELECTATFEGLSGKFNSIPVIVINSNIEEVTRRRFTILHELGHQILNIDEDEIDENLIEFICNAFAGAILLPEDIMIKEFKNRTKISFSELFVLKKQYGSSIQAILIRAADMKLIPWGKYHEWKDICNSYNTGTYDVNEKSERLIRLVGKCLSEDKITPNKAAILADMSPSDLINQLKYIEL
jgi:Zn-dependent peptidase ImmA (M78 family)/transcriptional regulator with XRE-family HTH domain